MKKFFILIVGLGLIGVTIAANTPLPLGSVMFDPVTKQVVRPENFWANNKTNIQLQLGSLGAGTPLVLQTGPGIFATISNDLNGQSILWIGFIGATSYTPPPVIDTNPPVIIDTNNITGTFYVDDQGRVLTDDQGRWFTP